MHSTTKQRRKQPETALSNLPTAYGIMAMSSDTLGLLASWLVPTVVHPLHAAVQARVFGANARQGAKCRNFGRGLLSVKGLQASDVYGIDHGNVSKSGDIWKNVRQSTTARRAQTLRHLRLIVTHSTRDIGDRIRTISFGAGLHACCK